jgi:hypothetical protein
MQKLMKNEKRSESVPLYFNPIEYRELRTMARGEKLGTFCRFLIYEALAARKEKGNAAREA